MPGIYSEALMEDELMLVLPPGHPFVGRNDLQPSDLAREHFIYHDAQSSTRRMTTVWARQQQVELMSKLELNSIEIIKRSVIRGHGITFMSKLAILEELQRGELVSMPVPCWQLKRSVYCCYHKDRWLTAPMRALLQLIRSERQRPFSDLSNPTPRPLHIMK